MKGIPLTLLGFLGFLLSCKKLEEPQPVCTIPFVDFVAQQVDPATRTVSFSAITSYNGTISSHQWDFGDGTTFTGPNPPPHQYPSTGNTPATYRIKYTVGNECGQSYWTKDITITGCLPIPKFIFTYVNDSTVQFTNQGTSASPVTYLWNFGDGTTSTSASTTLTHVFTSDQNFTASLKATNACGENFFTAPVRICREPVALQTVSQTSCNSVNFNASASRNAARFQWDLGNGTVLPASPGTSPTLSYSYPAAGTYTVKLTVINASNCDTATLSQQVTVSGSQVTPNNNWTYTSDDLDFAFARAAVPNANSYLWNFGDGTTSTQQNPLKTYTAPGNYNLTIQASSACGDYTFNAPITAPYFRPLSNTPATGMQDVVAISSSQIYYLGTNGRMYRTDTSGNWSGPIVLPSRLSFNGDTKLYKDGSNNVWIYGRNEVARYNTSGTPWTSFYSDTDLPNNITIQSIAVDNNGRIWTVANNQVRREDDVVSQGSTNQYNSIAYAPATGRMWFTAANRTSIYTVNGGGNNFMTINVTGIIGGADRIQVHPNGEILFTTATGIIRINTSGSVLTNYTAVNTGGLLTGAPSDYKFDAKGNVWAIQGRLLKIPLATPANAKNYSFTSELNSPTALDLFVVSGTDTDIMLAKTSGNAAVRIR